MQVLLQAVGGAVGGIGAGGSRCKTNGSWWNNQLLADLGGSYGGDLAGMAVGDGLMRAKINSLVVKV